MRLTCKCLSSAHTAVEGVAVAEVYQFSPEGLSNMWLEGACGQSPIDGIVDCLFHLWTWAQLRDPRSAGLREVLDDAQEWSDR